MNIVITIPSISQIFKTSLTTIESTKKFLSSRGFKIAKNCAIAGGVGYLLYTSYVKAQLIHKQVLLDRQEAKRQQQLSEERRAAEQKEKLRREQHAVLKRAIYNKRVLRYNNNIRILQANFPQPFLKDTNNFADAVKSQIFGWAARSRYKAARAAHFYDQLRLAREAEEAAHKAAELARAEQDKKDRKERLLRLLETSSFFQIQKKKIQKTRRVVELWMETISRIPERERLIFESGRPCIRGKFFCEAPVGTYSMEQAKQLSQLCKGHPGCLALLKVARQDKRFRPFTQKAKPQEPAPEVKPTKIPEKRQNAEASSSKLQIPATASSSEISSFSPLSFLKPELVAKKFVLPTDYRTSGDYYVEEEEAVVEILLREYKYYLTNQMASESKEYFKPGIKKLNRVQLLELKYQLEAHEKARAFPIAFMSSNHWTGERKASVEAQIKYCRNRKRLQDKGEWVEPTPEEKAKAREDKKKGKAQVRANVTSVVKNGVLVTAVASMPTTKATEVELPPSPPPVMNPLPVESFLAIQDEELERKFAETGKPIKLRPTQNPAAI